MTTTPKDTHICCDGECNHDDCCGKVPENCPHETKDTVEERDHKYAVDVKLLKRFYELYEVGREKCTPQNYIDYFQAEHYLLAEVEKALHATEARVRAETIEECKHLIDVHDPSMGRKTSPTYWGNTLRAALTDLLTQKKEALQKITK